MSIIPRSHAICYIYYVIELLYDLLWLILMGDQCIQVYIVFQYTLIMFRITF